MKDKDNDKRLIIPKDSFEEEASEGLGSLNREEAMEDLRELRGRIERRVRKPWMIWLPAAAAVVILLVASTVYIALFRERGVPETEIALIEEPITDTALIAMAEPIQKTELATRSRAAMPETTRISQKSGQGAVRSGAADAVSQAGAAHGMIAEDKDEVAATPEAAEVNEMAAVQEVMEEEAAKEVVIVEAMPKMDRTAAYVKKDKAAAKTTEDSVVAVPTAGDGRPEGQAEPVGGMEEFNKWIQENIRYPEDVAPKVRQVIVVTFKIAPDSTLYDLKAEQTPGDLFTQEAFRLLREGPKRVPAVRNGKVSEEEVRVSIVFR